MLHMLKLMQITGWISK